MKRMLIALLLVATAAAAQEKKTTEPDYNTTREFKNRIFDLKNREPHDIVDAIRLLGSGFKGSALNISRELKTITVRDFPENIAAIDEAIQRLDKPVAPRPDIEMRIWVLVGMKGPFNAAGPDRATLPAPNISPVPDELDPVIKQLKSTLRYTHYGLMTAVVQRTKAGENLEGSGIAEQTLAGRFNMQQPPFYSYRMARLTTTDTAVNIERFIFSMRVPIVLKANEAAQYQNVGFETGVSLKHNEKVVLGTTTMQDKALIVVVTAAVK